MSALGSKLRRRQGGQVSFMCPGCNTTHGVYIEPAADGRPRPVWGFNGDGDRPTFTPSVLVQSHTWTPPVTPENLASWKQSPWEQVQVATVCHSFVTDGRIQFLADCTHALAGQTVDLPDWNSPGGGMLGRLMARAAGTALPWWARLSMLLMLAASFYGLGRLQEARRGADAMAEYVAKQAAQTVIITKREVQVVTKVETKYRDRIQKIYVKGAQIENRIPEILTPDVDRRLPLPAGFVRILDAAWAGEPVGPALDSDREPATVPPSIVAGNEASNATSCKSWREKVFGWREFYAKQQVAINGKAGAWAVAALPAVPPE